MSLDKDGAFISKLWERDQQAGGIKPILASQVDDLTEKERSHGYVVLTNKNNDINFWIWNPDELRSRQSHQLVYQLLDNYVFDDKKADPATQQHTKEENAFIDCIVQTEVIKATREHINFKGDDDAWKKHLWTLWFQKFDYSTKTGLSGFEHVFVGESNKGKLGGHHFWFQYWLQDGAQGTQPDIITNENLSKITTPASVTLSYKLVNQGITADKPIGGFFVGCSAEFLVAVGVVLFARGGSANTVVEGYQYRLPFYFADDKTKVEIRTWWPELGSMVSDRAE